MASCSEMQELLESYCAATLSQSYYRSTEVLVALLLSLHNGILAGDDQTGFLPPNDERHGFFPMVT